MGGSSIEYGPRTIVLLGRTRSGKSATGNSILGRKAFESRASLSGVTLTTELQSSVLKNGQVVNVIDTPGLYDFGSEFGKEFVKCIDLAKDGIHAVLLVFSLRTGFSREEEAAFWTMLMFFGPLISRYIIVVFTGFDDLERNHETLEDYLGRECPVNLQNILEFCRNRVMPFNNNTDDEGKKESQLQKLLTIVKMMIEENGGQPYSVNWFSELREEANLRFQEEEGSAALQGLKEQLQKGHDEQLRPFTDMVEAKLQNTIKILEQQLAKERADRLRADETAEAALRKSNEELGKLNEDIRKSKEEIKMLEQQLAKERAARLRAEETAEAAMGKSKEELGKLKEDIRRSKEENAEKLRQIDNLRKQTAEPAQRKLKDDLDKLKKDLERANRENVEKLQRIHQLDDITRQPNCKIM